MGLFGTKKHLEEQERREALPKVDKVFGERKPVKCSSHNYEWSNVEGEALKFLRCIYCGWDKKHGFVCYICNKGKSKLKNNDMKQKLSQLFHPLCKEEQKKLKDMDLEPNPDFIKRRFDFDAGLEKLIHVSYETPHEIDVKLFFNENDWSLFSRHYTEKTDSNSVRLIIEIADNVNSSLVSGGNFDFNDDFDSGYTLLILLKHGDKKLLSHIAQKLRDRGFGCLPSTFSIMAHLNDVDPTNEKAKTIVSEITDELSHSIKQIDSS